ncbi:MAG TPA: helix-turn-helix domain-containing protein [Lapillicoccus sp.]|nr:helix-turn-helix domain-containing protein [Lapillicoccus sp.]
MRWEPGARERLQESALELFARNGFDQTTTAEIARSVGLTERTFFRHFSDKREVLFYGQQELVRVFVEGSRRHPPDSRRWRSWRPRCSRRRRSSRTSGGPSAGPARR